MQIILIEDVKSLGKKGTIVKVNDSYSYNVIIKKLEKTGDKESDTIKQY